MRAHDLVADAAGHGPVEGGRDLGAAPRRQVDAGGAHSGPERIVDQARPAAGLADRTLGQRDERARPGDPVEALAPERLDLDERLDLAQLLAGGGQVPVVEVGRDELRSREDLAVEHRAGRCAGMGLQLAERPRAIAHLPVSDRLGHAELEAHHRHVADRGGTPDRGGDAQGVDGPAGERVAERPRALEGEAPLGVDAQRPLALADVVGRFVPPLGEGRVPRHRVPAEPAQRVPPPAVPHGRHGLPGEHAAVAPTAADHGADRQQHGDPWPQAGVGAGAVRPPGQLLDQLHETLPVDEHVAPGELEHGAEVGVGDLSGDGGDRPLHHLLPAVVAEAAVLRGHEPERLARHVGPQPVLEREDRLAGLLVPAGGALVPPGQAVGLGRRRRGHQRGPHERMDLERPRRRDAGHEESAAPRPGGGGRRRPGARSGRGRGPS